LAVNPAIYKAGEAERTHSCSLGKYYEGSGAHPTSIKERRTPRALALNVLPIRVTGNKFGEGQEGAKQRHLLDYCYVCC